MQQYCIKPEQLCIKPVYVYVPNHKTKDISSKLQNNCYYMLNIGV